MGPLTRSGREGAGLTVGEGGADMKGEAEEERQSHYASPVRRRGLYRYVSACGRSGNVAALRQWRLRFVADKISHEKAFTIADSPRLTGRRAAPILCIPNGLTSGSRFLFLGGRAAGKLTSTLQVLKQTPCPSIPSYRNPFPSR